MGTTAQKLSYLNETKTKLKDKINLMGANITNDTFRSYPDKIKTKLVDYMNNGTEEIWNNWDKVNGSGTELTLNNTIQAPMKLELKGNTSQDTYTGKNLVDTQEQTITGLTMVKQDDGSLLVNGTISEIKFAQIVYMPDYTLSAGTYTLSCFDNTGQNYAGDFYIGSQYVYKNATNDKTLTIEAGTYNVRLQLYLPAKTYTNVKIYIQLENGNSKTSYEKYVGGKASPNPDYPQEVKVVKGDNTIRVEGKNRFNYTKSTSNFRMNNNDGLFSMNTTYTACGISVDSSSWGKYDLKIPTTATISISFKVRSNNLTAINNSYLCTNDNEQTTRVNISMGSITGISSEWTTFTKVLNKTSGIETDKCGLMFYFSSTSSLEIKDIMIGFGNDTTYEPYKGTDYSIDLSSYNLFDINDMQWDEANDGIAHREGNTFVINCTTSQYGSVRLAQRGLRLKPNTTYTFSARVLETNSTSGASVFVGGSLNNTGSSFYGNQVQAKNTSYATFTTPSGTISGDAFLGLYPRGTNTYAIFDQIQITESNTLLPFKEYVETPVEYCKIGNYEDKFIRTSGKNLLNYGTKSFTTYYQEYGLNIPSGTYTFSAKITSSDSNSTISRIYFYNSSGTSLGYLNLDRNTRASQTITINDTIDRITLYASYDYSSSSGDTATYEDIMLNEGTTALPYEPYGTDEWYIKKNIVKEVLDGTEVGTNYTNGVLYNNNEGTLNYTLNQIVYSNYFNYGGTATNTSGAYNNGNNTISLHATDKHTYYIRNDNLTSLADWKTWLGTNKPELYYVLATPTYTQITGTLAEQLENIWKAQSKDGVTNISQVNNDLPFVLDVSALENIN